MTIEICPKEKCTGCTACKSKCPKSAISMKQNDEGFFYPTINEQLCINCHLCQKVCPVNNLKKKNSTSPSCYAVMAEDSLREHSSSGAFFPILAEYVLSQEGFVVGAAFDDDMILNHVIISSLSDLKKLKTSKYLQSQLSDVFSKVNTLLNQNKLVLFIGTPCQVAGLNQFLGTENKNLITVDFICHGVPSQTVFDEYLKSEFPNKKITHLNFRDKRKGWQYTTVAQTEKKEIVLGDDIDYLKAFFSNVCLRKSCSTCPFTNLPRVGDLTMGDFWGVPSEMNDNKGTSLVLLNNSKGEEIFQKIKNRFKKVKEYDVSLPLRIQPQLNHPISEHPAREEFFKNLKRLPFNELLNKTILSSKNVGILNFHWENCNFGAILTSYALNRFLNKKGFFARNIDYIPNFWWIKDEAPNPYFDAFRNKYLPRTSQYHSGDSLQDLNNEFSTFIVGSDQVWRHEFIQNERDAFFFSFADLNKKLISYAASFGVDKINAPESDLEDYKMRISLFDHISVREASGVKICQDLGIKATQVCDPVFLLGKEEWENLASQEKHSHRQSEIVFYTISEEMEGKIRNFISENKTHFNYHQLTNITENTSIEEWLYRIQNCQFFITDSFHGSCFALIFNKPFVCVNPNKNVSTRMESLFDELGVKNRLYTSFDEIDLNTLLSQQMDGEKIAQCIEKRRKFSEKFLLDAIYSQQNRSLEKKQIKQEFQNKLYQWATKNKNKVFYKYILYKVLSKITFGKKRKKYKAKRAKFKSQYKQIKSILKNYTKEPYV